jgi:hypothetical protein
MAKGKDSKETKGLETERKNSLKQLTNNPFSTYR